MPPRSTPRPGAAPQVAKRQVVALPLRDSDIALVAALKAGRADARSALFERYASDVQRVLYRVLGPDAEVVDLVQDVFVAALTSIGQLRDPSALRSWLTGIAVYKARKCIVRRRRWRFIHLFAPGELPEREALLPSAEVSEALRSTYAVLEKMPADERVAFALRFIDGMELTAVAQARGVSLATIKRHLRKAQQTFRTLAAAQPALAPWLDNALDNALDDAVADASSDAASDGLTQEEQAP